MPSLELFQDKSSKKKQDNKIQNKKQLKHMFIIVALLCLAHTIAALQVGSVEFYVSTMPGKYESCQIALAEQTKGCTVDNKNLYDVRFELKKNAHQLHSVNKQLAEFSQKYTDTNQNNILLSRENIKLQGDIVQYGFSLRSIYNSLHNADHDNFEKKQIIANLNKQLQEAEQTTEQRAFYSQGLTLAFVVTLFCFLKFWFRTRQSTATNANQTAATTQATSCHQRNAPVLTATNVDSNRLSQEPLPTATRIPTATSTPKPTSTPTPAATTQATSSRQRNTPVPTTTNAGSSISSQEPSPTAVPTPTVTPSSTLITTPTPIDEVKVSATPRSKTNVYSRTSPPARSQGRKSRWIIRGNKAYFSLGSKFGINCRQS
jgi:cytoskeletal protein RodZ